MAVNSACSRICRPSSVSCTVVISAACAVSPASPANITPKPITANTLATVCLNPLRFLAFLATRSTCFSCAFASAFSSSDIQEPARVSLAISANFSACVFFSSALLFCFFADFFFSLFVSLTGFSAFPSAAPPAAAAVLATSSSVVSPVSVLANSASSSSASAAFTYFSLARNNFAATSGSFLNIGKIRSKAARSILTAVTVSG